MSLNRNKARWYLIGQHNASFSRVIIAAETTGSILDRLRIAWVFEYGALTSLCNLTEGPLLSIDRKWLFVVNTTGVLIITDKDQSASIEYFVSLKDLCISDMAYLDINSTLLLVDKHTFNIIGLNVSTRLVSYISLKDLCQEEIIGQLSRMTIIQNNRLIIVLLTAAHKAVLLLIDYTYPRLIGRFELDYVPDISTLEPLTQLAYTKTEDQHIFVTIAHEAVGLITVQLRMS